jgi:4-amino-4-deoxy-L-arabinose transferase-like glycosyltransferase
MIPALNKIDWLQREHKYLIFLVILFILYNLLFINKALHIDDPFTIKIARAVNENFINVPQVFHNNPILLGYYYAPIIRLLGEQEKWLHIFFLPFSLLIIISMHFLSLRFIGKEFLPILFLVITPAFLIMSEGIMLDIPLLGFFLSALATFIYGIDKDNQRLLFLSAILAGIACLIKYSGLVVILLMFIYTLLSSKKRYCLFLLIPIFIFFLWYMHNVIFYKHAYFFEALLLRLRETSINIILIRIFASLSFISGTSIISLFLIPHLLRNKTNVLLLLLSLPVGLCPFLIKEPFLEYSHIEKFILMFLFISSLFILFIVFKTALLSLLKSSYNKDNLFLSLWFFIFLVFNVLTQFIAARFVLLLFPPMFLLIFKELILNKISLKSNLGKLIPASIVITILISTILAIGDYNFAGIYRDFVISLKRKIPFDKSIYFCPVSYRPYFSWGYAYYLHKYFPQEKNVKIEENFGRVQNLFYVLPSQPVLPLVIHKTCLQRFQELNYNKKLVNSFCYRSNAVLHNQKFHVGFYSQDWGLLPFYISLRKVTLETFEVYRLSVK